MAYKIVIDEIFEYATLHDKNGREVALVLDKKDAPMFALAPDMAALMPDWTVAKLAKVAKEIDQLEVK